MGFEPELHLEHGERALLAAITPTEGFAILHRLMRAEVDKFIVALINSDPADKEDAITRLILAKAAAQFYQAVTNRVNEEVTQYTAAPRADDKPVDVAANLDMGDIASLPNLLGGEEEDFE